MNSVADPLLALYRRLADTGLRCMVGGSVAAMVYGEPRSTLDIDVIVEAGADDAATIETAFPRDIFYFPPTPTLVDELSRPRDGSFQILEIGTAFKADVYVVGEDALIRYGISNRELQEIAGEAVFVAPPSYIVAMKLKYYSVSEQPKHLDDIRGILRTSPDQVDRSFVEKWATEFGVQTAWQECL